MVSLSAVQTLDLLRLSSDSKGTWGSRLSPVTQPPCGKFFSWPELKTRYQEQVIFFNNGVEMMLKNKVKGRIKQGKPYAGCLGAMIPQVESREEAQEAVESTNVECLERRIIFHTCFITRRLTTKPAYPQTVHHPSSTLRWGKAESPRKSRKPVIQSLILFGHSGTNCGASRINSTAISAPLR